MGLCGWYECYVVDDGRGEVSLAMQFLKWGDAAPGEARAERAELERCLERLGGRAPVERVGRLLEHELGEAAEELPPAFPLGAYAFFLLRAAQEERRGRRSDRRLVAGRRESPVGLALGGGGGERRGVAAVATGVDPVVERAHFAIEVGRFERRWRASSAERTFLEWLQSLTQSEPEPRPGFVAGDYEAPSHVAFRYRLFLRVPELVRAAQPVSAIDLEVCGARGDPILGGSAPTPDRPDSGGGAGPSPGSAATDGEPLTLARVRETHRWVPAAIWEGRLRRNDYLGP